MATPTRHAARVWELAERQHGLITAAQLLELGYTSETTRHRIAAGRLHRIYRGVYAVGRPDLTDHGIWMAATLAVAGSRLSHLDAALLQRLLRGGPGSRIDLSIVSVRGFRRRAGLRVHRRRPGVLGARLDCEGIPATNPADTIIDIASRVGDAALERAINEADKLGLATPRQLRDRAALQPQRPGAARLRGLIDRVTLVLSDSELERWFLPLASAAGLAVPETGARLNGYRVDFWWPGLGLVVETDGGRFHRTPLQQTRDRRRDQAHTAAGLTQLRFTHGQVRYQPDEVIAVLEKVAARLARDPA